MNDYYDYYDYYSYSSPPAYNPVFTIISLVLCVFVLVCMWIIFRKAGKPGWAAIVPFYNLYVLFEITWGSGMRFLLLLIPIYNEKLPQKLPQGATVTYTGDRLNRDGVPWYIGKYTAHITIPAQLFTGDQRRRVRVIPAGKDRKFMRSARQTQGVIFLRLQVVQRKGVIAGLLALFAGQRAPYLVAVQQPRYSKAEELGILFALELLLIGLRDDVRHNARNLELYVIGAGHVGIIALRQLHRQHVGLACVGRVQRLLRSIGFQHTNGIHVAELEAVVIVRRQGHARRPCGIDPVRDHLTAP